MSPFPVISPLWTQSSFERPNPHINLIKLSYNWCFFISAVLRGLNCNLFELEPLALQSSTFSLFSNSFLVLPPFHFVLCALSVNCKITHLTSIQQNIFRAFHELYLFIWSQNIHYLQTGVKPSNREQCDVEQLGIKGSVALRRLNLRGLQNAFFPDTWILSAWAQMR